MPSKNRLLSACMTLALAMGWQGITAQVQPKLANNLQDTNKSHRSKSPTLGKTTISPDNYISFDGIGGVITFDKQNINITLMDTTIESTNLQYRFAEMQSNLSYSYDIVVPTTLTPLQQMYLLLFYEYMENTQPSEDKKNIMASLIIIVEGKYPMTEVKRFPTILSGGKQKIEQMDKAFEAVRDYKWSTTSQAIQRANNASPISSDRYTTTTQEGENILTLTLHANLDYEGYRRIERIDKSGTPRRYRLRLQGPKIEGLNEQHQGYEERRDGKKP